MRLVGCVRVSRVSGRHGDSFISPRQQRDRIKSHAAAQGHTVVGWQEDLDQPGSTMNRPGLEEALLMVERGDADGIAVAKLDRFARSVAGAARTLERLESAGGVLVAVDLGMDTSTPAGRLMRNVLVALAEFELDRIRENWRDSTARAVGRGVHIAKVPPFGYRRRDDGRLEPDPEHAPLARHVFEMRADGERWKDIAAFLDQYAPRAEGVWPWQTVWAIVARRTYLGEAFQGEIVNPDAHEAIVDRDLWERAQSSERRPPQRGGGALLAGLVRCAACGYTMTRAGDGARGYTNYRCRGRHSAGVCPEPARISERRADDFVIERFLARADGLTARDDELTVDVERAVAAIEQAEAELSAYRDAQLVSVIGARAYREGLELRARAVDDARAVLADRRRRNPSLLGKLDLADEWPRLPTDDRRVLLASAIDAVFVRRAHLPGRSAFEDRLWICWAGDAPRDLPGRRVVALRPFVFPDDRPRASRVASAE